MVKSIRVIAIISLIMILLSACQAEETVIPTLVEFPTATETSTPTNTATATVTPNSTATPTATNTNTSTPTNTPTSTFTALPTVTPTHTATWTPSPTLTPSVTFTAIPTRTEVAPVIRVFQSNKVQTTPGSPIFLRWDVDADTARIEVLDQAGTVLQTIPVDLVGSLTTNVPSAGIQVIYRMVASRGGSEIRSTVTIELGVACTFPWTFQNMPVSEGCPQGPVFIGQLAYQQLQTGFMFRVISGSLNRVCGIQFDRNIYSCYAYQAYTGTPSVTPPTGLFAPSADIAYSFYNDLAVGGFWYSIAGWATGSVTTAPINAQTGENGRLYIQTPLGIYAFDGQLTGQGLPAVRVITTQ